MTDHMDFCDVLKSLFVNTKSFVPSRCIPAL